MKSKCKLLYLAVLLLIVLALVLPTPILAYVAGQKWNANSVSYRYEGSMTFDWDLGIEGAVEEWNDSGADFYFYYDSNSDNYLWLEDTGPGYLGLTQHYPDTGYLEWCGTQFNTWFDFRYGGGEEQIDTVSEALHELGHWLRLGHSQYSNAVMWGVLGYGDLKQELYSDDINGIIYQYGS